MTTEKHKKKKSRKFIFDLYLIGHRSNHAHQNKIDEAMEDGWKSDSALVAKVCLDGLLASFIVALLHGKAQKGT